MCRVSPPNRPPTSACTPAPPEARCAATFSPCVTGVPGESPHATFPGLFRRADVSPAAPGLPALVLPPQLAPAPLPDPAPAAAPAPAPASGPRPRHRVRAVAAVGAVRRVPPVGPVASVAGHVAAHALPGRALGGERPGALPARAAG